MTDSAAILPIDRGILERWSIEMGGITKENLRGVTTVVASRSSFLELSQHANNSISDIS